jgi:hypothetical protein
MRTLLSFLVPAVPLVVLLAAAQNPRPPDPQPPKPLPTPEARVTLSEGARKEAAKTTKAMQGLWELKELVWPKLDGLSSEFRGYCLVSGNHLDFEVHIGLRDADHKLGSVLLDCGIWRFEVFEANRTVMTALIGSFIDKDNHVAFRDPDTRCRYEVLAIGDQMIWRKEDGQRLEFVRIDDKGPPRVDAFGRTLPDEPDPDTDAKDPGTKDPGAKDSGAKSPPRKPGG